MTATRGKKLAQEREWGRVDHDGRVRERSSIRSVRVYKRYWWPHPLARRRGLLWVKVVIGHRYFDTDGKEICRPGPA